MSYRTCRTFDTWATAARLSTPLNFRESDMDNDQTTDITLVCRDCGDPFVFTAGERDYFAAMSRVNPSVAGRAGRPTRSAISSTGDDRDDSAPITVYFVISCSN